MHESKRSLALAASFTERPAGRRDILSLHRIRYVVIVTFVSTCQAIIPTIVSNSKALFIRNPMQAKHAAASLINVRCEGSEI